MGSRRTSVRLLQQVVLGIGLMVDALQQFSTHEFQIKVEIISIVAV